MRGAAADIEALAEICAKVEDTATLSRKIEAFVRDCGFRWFALTKLVDFQRDEQSGVIIQDFPAQWYDEIVEERLFDDSAMLKASALTFGGVCWNKIPERIALTDRQKDTLRRGRGHGLTGGFTYTMPILGGPGAAFSVARRKQDDINEGEKVLIRAIGTIALESARRILGLDGVPKGSILSVRQRECTALVAQGKTDWEIGQIIGIGRDTVHEYIEAARKKFDVRSRPQLVLAAFRSGELGELDVGHPNLAI